MPADVFRALANHRSAAYRSAALGVAIAGETATFWAHGALTEANSLSRRTHGALSEPPRPGTTKHRHIRAGTRHPTGPSPDETSTGPRARTRPDPSDPARTVGLVPPDTHEPPTGPPGVLIKTPAGPFLFYVGPGGVSAVVLPNGTATVVDAERVAVALGGPDQHWLAWADMTDTALRHFPDADPEQVLRTVAVSKDQRKKLALQAAVGRGPRWLGWALSDDPERLTRQRLVETTLDTAMLDWLSEDSRPEVRKAVAGNWRCAPALIDRLASDTDWNVRARAAKHHAATHETLTRIAADPHPEVLRFAAGRRSGTGTDLLHGLASSPRADVRIEVARNPRTPPGTLDLLARDPHPDVREAVASNRSTSRAAIDHLADHDTSSIVQAAIIDRRKTHPDRLARLARSRINEDRVAVAGDPNATPRTLTGLADDPTWSVRATAAEHPAIPVEALLLLLDDPRSYQVRNAAAGHLSDLGLLP